MADTELPEPTKEKRIVPAMVRTARGVADHAAAVQEMQWDKERKSFKDPITVTLALFAYAKLTAALLDEAERRYDARMAALEAREEKLETQIAAFESWRTDIMKQNEGMAKEFEEMMQGVESPEDAVRIVCERLGRKAGEATAKSVIAAAKPVIVDTTVEAGENGAVVTPLKPPKKQEEKGGAA